MKLLGDPAARPASSHIAASRVFSLARDLAPSARGRYEINCLYMEAGDLHVVQMSRGYAWLDPGTQDSLLEADEFVCTLQHRQGLQIVCLEEIAYGQGCITVEHAPRR